jgi:flagellar biosynthesis/type III secretory pathway protein FliH
MVMGHIQQAREQGIEQGIEQGVRQGRTEGGRAVLERQLRRRFGPLPTEAAERLRGAPEADVEAWADNVLDAATLDEVFGAAR